MMKWTHMNRLERNSLFKSFALDTTHDKIAFWNASNTNTAHAYLLEIKNINTTESYILLSQLISNDVSWTELHACACMYACILYYTEPARFRVIKVNSI